MVVNKGCLEISKFFHVSVKWNKGRLLTYIYHSRSFCLTAGFLLQKKKSRVLEVLYLSFVWILEQYQYKFFSICFINGKSRGADSQPVWGNTITPEENHPADVVCACAATGPQAVPFSDPSPNKGSNTKHRNVPLLNIWELWHPDAVGDIRDSLIRTRIISGRIGSCLRDGQPKTEGK